MRRLHKLLDADRPSMRPGPPVCGAVHYSEPRGVLGQGLLNTAPPAKAPERKKMKDKPVAELIQASSTELILELTITCPQRPLYPAQLSNCAGDTTWTPALSSWNAINPNIPISV
ncbi:unnamed protein product [Pleuronectes platessa]|uniref:Uncharacterized protein n=1 Tax=Pleuronectes platessa TaxID=8262 RepID=A0A9N7UCL0_PLEPL|nr:unnamed protein product [Pleuronectes platessa]